ncbi:MAG: FAD/NAD(P)-binding protein [Actinomycetota bacterium]
MYSVGRPDAATEPMLPRLHRVRSTQSDGPDVVTLGLEPEDSQPMSFGPGQFNMLWAFGVGEAAISVRAGSDGLLLHSIREVGAITRALCAMKLGDVVGVRGPFGSGWDVEDGRDRDVVLVAGGLGLAPILPAAWEIAGRRADYRRALLLVGARSPGQMLFRRDLEQLQSRGLEVQMIVDHASAGWSGQVGLVTELVERSDFDASSALALVCGPEVMMRFTARALTDRGVPAGAVRISMERNMKCAIGLCGHCQLGPEFVCRDGPVFDYERMQPLMKVREL